MCQDCRDNPNKAAALRKAREAARSGYGGWAQTWVNRAASFASVSPRQLKNVQRLLDKARKDYKVIS